MIAVLPSNIRSCAHRKTNGIPCGSPALKNKPYCYFHNRYREQSITLLNGQPISHLVNMDLPLFEDANGIQMCLTKVFHLLLSGLLDPKLAKSLIYCLQIATQNLRNTNFNPSAEDLADNADARRDQSLSHAVELPSESDKAAEEDEQKPDQDVVLMPAAEKRPDAIAADEQKGIDIHAIAEDWTATLAPPMQTPRNFPDPKRKPKKSYHAPVNLFERRDLRRARSRPDQDCASRRQ
jgi:hypothetical protein